MRKVLVIVASVIAAAAIVAVGMYVFSDRVGETEIVVEETKIAEEPGRVITRSDLEITKVMEPGMAMAMEDFNCEKEGVEHNIDLVVVLQDTAKRVFKENEIVKVPEGMCVRQVGMMETEEGSYPVVRIMK